MILKREQKKRLNLLIVFFIGLLFSSCVKEEFTNDSLGNKNGLVFKLYEASYNNDVTRNSENVVSSSYDKLVYYIMDNNGELVHNIKTKYIPESSEIVAEGLREGKYKLLVLGIKGDYLKDNVTVNEINKVSDIWLSFPDKIEKPLEAEYFHSYTPFSVELRTNENGSEEEVVVIDQRIIQKRIISCLNFTFDYNNPYIKTSVVDNQIKIVDANFSKAISGEGIYSGTTTTSTITIPTGNEGAICLLPETNSSLKGTINMVTRSFEKDNIYRRSYSFEQKEVKRNYKNDVRTNVIHPNDKSGFMFVTADAYKVGNHKKILQDDEPKAIYADENQRKFNTAQPLQTWVSDEGNLHVRFYSPKGLSDVSLKVKIPSISDEYLEFAYFDTIPPFADFSEIVPSLQKQTIYRSESGKLLEVSPIDIEIMKQAEWKIESNCDYWKKLQEIKYGWDISFHLYNGDPDKEDGGPVGNWMGIRPVHCRESVAFFLNYTCLLGFKEVDDLMKSNPDKLFNDKKEPVAPETVLEQMRMKRNLRTGLIYEGNGVSGLGGGSTWGVAEWIYFQHYTNPYACNLALHEVGHVMGYGHSSAFTYGPWAQELMNHFYVNNIKRLPIDSPDYLDSKNNPNKYYK